MERLSKNDQLLLAAFGALLAFLVPCLFRGLDDNTLTSWNWVFGTVSVLPVFGLVLAGTAAAFFLSPLKASERSPAVLLFVLGVLTAVPLWSEPEVVLDAGRYFLQAKYLEQHGIAAFFREWGRSVGAWTDLPVGPLLYGVLFRYGAEARWMVQAVTTMFFAGALVLTFRIGKRLWNAEAGFHGALLLAAIPSLLVQVPLMLVDVPAMFFVALALDRFLDALERGGAFRICLAALAIFLACFAKFSVPLMLLVLPLAAFVMPAGRVKQTARLAEIGAAASCLILPVVVLKWEVIRSQLALLSEYQLPGLSRWHESLLSTFFFQIHPFVTIFALLGAAAALRRRERRFLVPLFFACFGLRVERVRYILPLFPLLALASSYGLRQLRTGEVRNFVAYSAAAASLAVALGGYLPFLNRTTMANLRDAGVFLDTLPGNSVLVRVLPQQASAGNTELSVPILDYYTAKRIVYQRQQEPAPPEHYRLSPLRFTWECALPAYYFVPEQDASSPVAVISSKRLSWPGRSREFASDTGTFRYRTLVTVVDRPVLAGTAP